MEQSTINFKIPESIRNELGQDGRIITGIKVVRQKDRVNTHSVFLCMKDGEIEDVAPTAMQKCGLATVLDGKFVLIHDHGETTLHYTGAKNENSVIDEVYTMSERCGLAKGIAAYKQTVPRMEAAG